MKFLLFRLYAPLASWGDVAVGEFRPSYGYPGRSALLGLIGAALGVDRHDEARLRQLDDALAFAVAVYSEGALLRDYHTAQVPRTLALVGVPHRTRADELVALARDKRTEGYNKDTIPSTRDYRQDALCVAGAWVRSGANSIDLTDLRAALERPRFTLYLGRKACPPALPLSPKVVEAAHFRAALESARFPDVGELAVLSLPAQPRRVAWEDGADLGWPPSFSVPRKDAPLSRRRWQFGDRTERVALIAAPGSTGSAEDDVAP